MIEEEFELTYLVSSLPEGVVASPSKEIVDIYLPASAAHATLRIRKSGDRYSITKKIPVTEGDASHQVEHTIAITEAEFNELALIPGKRVVKKRYFYNEGGVDYQIDVFQDTLSGLVLADVEFGSRAALDAFVAPAWFLADVTQEDFIAGGMLCGKRYDEIAPELARFNYQKIG